MTFSEQLVKLAQTELVLHTHTTDPRQDIRGRGGYMLQALKTAEATGSVVAFDKALVELLLSGVLSNLHYCFSSSTIFIVVMSMQRWNKQRQPDR